MDKLQENAGRLITSYDKAIKSSCGKTKDFLKRDRQIVRELRFNISKLDNPETIAKVARTIGNLIVKDRYLLGGNMTAEEAYRLDKNHYEYLALKAIEAIKEI